MKYFVILFLTIFISVGIQAQDIDSKTSTFLQYYEEEQYEQAIAIGTELLNEMGEMPKDNEDYLNILSKLADCYFYNGETERAIELDTQTMELSKKLFGEEHPSYANLLNDLAVYYSDLGDHGKAIDLGTQAMEIRKRVLGEEHPLFIISLNNLASYFSDIEDYDKAIEYGTQIAEIQKKVQGEEHPDYATALFDLAGYYYDLEDYETALALYTQALSIRKKSLGEERLDYAYSLSNLASCYHHLGNYIKAVELGTQVMEICKKKLGEEHLDYANSLSNLAIYYSYIGNYTKVIELATKSMEILKAALGEEHLDYANSLNSLAAYYFDSGNYTKAIEFETQALESYRKIVSERNPEYAYTLIELASYHSENGEYDKAFEIINQAVMIMKNVYGEGDPNYAAYLRILADCYSDLGNYDKAVELCNKAIDIYKNAMDDESTLYAKLFYAKLLNSLACYYAYLDNYDKAIEVVTQALSIRGNLLGKEHPDYANTLHNLAAFYSNIGEYTYAIELESQALDIYRKAFGGDHPKYLNFLSGLADCYFDYGDYGTAIELETQVLDSRKRVLGDKHPHYGLSLRNLSSYYFEYGNYPKAIEFKEKQLNFLQSFLCTNISGLSKKHRTILWNLYESYFRLYPYFIFYDENIIGDVYDKTCLFSKGLLLSADTEMRTLILESGDNDAIEKFDQLQSIRGWLNKLYETPIADRNVSTDSLEQVAEKLETDLTKISKSYGDIMQNMKLTWRDVQSQLQENEIAIEFISFPWLGGDTTLTLYLALALRRGYESPHMKWLFDDGELCAIETNYYSGTELSSFVWEPLKEELDGVENIYFAPSGELYSIAIESMPHWTDSCMMSDRYNIYRLSSTRELVTHQPPAPTKNATLFGGIAYDSTYTAVREAMPIVNQVTDNSNLFASIDYNVTYEALKAAFTQVNSDGDFAMNTEGSKPRGVFDNRTLRYGVPYLKYTLPEVKEVDEMLTKRGFSCDTIIGIHASEESFKALSGQRKSLIHIATHGFYYDTEEADNMSDNMRLTLIGDERPDNYEDQSLLRCGLCFAGANQILQDSLPPKGQDDGILNALEIAQIDLRGLDLIVLSACQTALGDIAQGEGVFGLQRGFKKAGAQSILMSLWEVDDEATHLLMTEFYKGWTSGLSKYSALKQAQSVVKEKYPDPKYWAAFILLDALD